MMPISDIACVILAGGQGKRMASEDLHKVCFPILGVPAIVRAIHTYKKAGLRRFVVVVGQMSEQVISTVSCEHPEVSFVFQAEPRGTGHAAMVAVEALAAQGYRGPVVVVMGDKVTRASVVRRLVDRFADADVDVLLTSLPKQPGSTSGRVVLDGSGKILGIVEAADIAHARKSGRKIRLQDRLFSSARIDSMSRTVNVSLYVFDFGVLRESLGKLGSENAQGEIYLTDTIERISESGEAEQVLIPDPTDLMAYNTPAELVAIEEVLRQRERPPRVKLSPHKRLPGSGFRTAGEWLRIFSDRSDRLLAAFSRLYGREQPLIEERRKEMIRLSKAFAKRYGSERKMVICRAPGRINLMGRHVDHRGGYVNVMAISQEVLLAAAPRKDSLVTLRNLRPRLFPPRQFDISEMIGEASWTDWLDFVASRAVRSVIQAAPGDWSHYARAPLLRLQHECPQAQLLGMDCVVTGNILMGAGLSSSSAMVVAFAQAAAALNGLDVTMRDFVDLCGEGEWFVGSRGGSADHAAISGSRRGYISRIGFYPYRMEGEVRFPSSLRMVIAYSGQQAVKSAAARDVFNQRVACYDIVEMFLRRNWPPAAAAEHLRDVSSPKLKVRSSEIYRALTLLPTKATRSQLRRALPADQRGRLEDIFATHANIGPYDLRGVALYGLGECIRSEHFSEALASQNAEKLGRDMRCSHDGDRIVRFGPDGPRPFIRRTDDATLNRLAEENAPIESQCGRYKCSTEAIDQLVDISYRTDGVIGAQLAGAGLGGCMMILVREDALDLLLDRLRKQFYRPRGLRFEAHLCLPVAGAGLVRI